MDVLRPQIVRIGNRYYRKNLMQERGNYNPEDEIESEFDASHCNYDDETCDTNLNIEETSGGFCVRLTIPSVYFGLIIGKKGEMKKRIEAETKTQITIPKAGYEGEIVIQGHDKKGVISAKTRLEVLVDSARQREPFTHFLSIPVQSEDIVAKFEEFQFSVLEDPKRSIGVDPSIFQNPQKLHLTIGTLVLLNETEVTKAKEKLAECFSTIVEPMLNGSPLFVDVRGLEYMNDDPGAVDILYAKIKSGPEADKLNELANRIVDRFLQSRLMQRQYERVKLHITVMNTLFRKDTSGTAVPRQQKSRSLNKDRESFNATPVLKNFGDYEFGSLHVDRIDLSQRHSVGPDGYYASSLSLRLP